MGRALIREQADDEETGGRVGNEGDEEREPVVVFTGGRESVRRDAADTKILLKLPPSQVTWSDVVRGACPELQHRPKCPGRHPEHALTQTQPLQLPERLLQQQPF